MDKQKQIEEMASCLVGEVVTGADSTKVLSLGYMTVKEISYILVNAGYRKIPENAVVLTREEYEELQVGNDFNYGVHCGESNMKAYYENIRLPEVRKETAEEFAEKTNQAINAYRKKVGKDEYVVDARRLIFEVNEIAKEFTGGVE